MWNSVKQARVHGWNIRHTEGGWQVAELAIDGWHWKPFTFPTKDNALFHAHTIYRYGA